MSNRCLVFCVLLAGFCLISWKHSLIGVNDALKLAGRGFIFLGICTWLTCVLQRLKYFFFPVHQELPDSPLHESNRQREEQVRRVQQHQHNDKISDYAESVIKPRQASLLQQRMEKYYRIKGETWKLSQGFPVGEEDQMCGDADVDENPNQGARRRRKPLQTVTQDPDQQEVPKQKEVKKVIVLPDEPSADTEGVVKLALRCPSGRTIYRRFLKTQSSLLLLHWMMKAGYRPSLYTLCTSYPRTELITAADLSLEEAGILTNIVLNVEEKELYIT
ncbi:UBX domain-containing protein 8 [Puntigrus tetrazona]|uniref:UBX domain-containing protein 8 n=1 Tax=Puntigrus tetrazona TaxID=1606681 RepID=UPI001C893699|nr:UBX domain-containing protein 8 [Puntigrus tetrazona]